MNWINDYVDLSGIDTEEIVKRFNLSTAEIEGYEVKGEKIQNVVFGKVLEVNDHPESTHLHVLKVDVGDEILQIVLDNFHWNSMLYRVRDFGRNICYIYCRNTFCQGMVHLCDSVFESV